MQLTHAQSALSSFDSKLHFQNIAVKIKSKRKADGIGATAYPATSYVAEDLLSQLYCG